MTMLAVFKSRSETLDFISFLRANGVPASAVSTPKEAGVGCGISVRFEACFLTRARVLLSKKRYSSYAGILKNTGFGWLFL